MMRRSLNAQNVRKFCESAMTQFMLEDLGYELLFIDEFSINFRQRTTYGWAPIGKKGFIDIDTDTFDMSFMVGFSQQGLYGLIGTLSSNNSSSFIRFIKHTIEHRTKTLKVNDWKFIIVWDNASLHTSKEVREYINSTKIIILTINPYSPCLNPAERLILYIKKKVAQIRQRRK